MALGKLYMIPVPLAENAMTSLSAQTHEICGRIRHFYVEHLREARRFLKSVDKNIEIDSLSFAEMHKNTDMDTSLLKDWLSKGYDVGVISDAGCPGIADPGAQLAAQAQQMGAKVVPISGPNSILLALMASGLNGQHFHFNGYLPIKDPQRSQKIKALESISAKENATQIFIETPYRNNQLLKDLLTHCGAQTRLSIAVNITAEDEWIRTQTVAEWKKRTPQLEKKPAIFMILSA